MVSVNFGHFDSLQGHLILIPSRIHAIEAVQTAQQCGDLMIDG